MNKKCYYPDWEGGYEVGEHSFDKEGYCTTCGELDRKTAYQRALMRAVIEDIKNDTAEDIQKVIKRKRTAK